MLAGRRTARLRAVLASGPVWLVLLAVPALASAAPPSANDDTMGGSPTAVRDVLANDSDPEGQALTIASNTQPAHGKASCSALGACFYTADAGFSGTDTFTYSARDTADGQSTATVTVHVGESTAQRTLSPRDDDAATLAGRAVSIKVLANDGGTGLTLNHASAPKHGTVDCNAGGTCEYQPAAGYTGSDGFVYRVQDADEREATAAVHVLVAPADAGYGLTASGAPVNPSGGAVPPGGQARWGMSVRPTPAGITGQELGAIGAPAGSIGLDGPHALTGGSLQAARGWSTEVGADGVLRYRAGNDALLGDALTQVFARPLPPISQGTGGDGHVPILVGSKVFAFYHHSRPTSVTCVDRSSGSLCPGYPKPLGENDLGTTDINGPGVVVGSRLYTHLLTASSFAQTASIGLFCWDAETDSTCGLTIVARVPMTVNPGASAPVRANGKMWFGGDTGRLYCVDPTTGDACASIATGLTSIEAGENYDIVSHGDRVYLARRNDKVACVDVATATPCAGWSTPKDFGGKWNLVNQHDGSGATIGVCVFSAGNGSCVTDADPDTSVPVTNFVNHDPYSQGYSHTLEAETGVRTLVGSLSDAGLGCYDWSTMAPCSGGAYDSDGWLRRDSAGGSLPSAYGAAFDGGCVIGLGDPGRVFTVDPAGASPCLSLASGTDRTTVDLRDQRCDRSVGGAAWRNVRLSDTDGEEMESVIVTVRDAATGAVLRSGEMTGGTQTLDLSGIDATAHPAITIDANAKSAAGNTPWDDGIPPRITVSWTSDPQQSCIRTTGNGDCAAAPSTVGVLGRLDSPAAAESAARLTLLRRPCTAGGVQGQSSRSCAGRRQFNIHIRFKGKDMRGLRVTLRGKKQKILRMRPRPVVRIDLRGLARTKVIVKISFTDKAGRHRSGTRVYHPCTEKRPGRGFRY